MANQADSKTNETTKTNEPKSQPAPLRKCKQCSGTRFQRHERGTFAGTVFVLDEVVVQCLGCHSVCKVEELD